MKVTQKELFEPSQDDLTINKVRFGLPVIDKKSGNLIVRVKPVNFVLNSALITDVINRGRVFVVNLKLGTMYVTEGNRPVEEVNSELTWSRK